MKSTKKNTTPKLSAEDKRQIAWEQKMERKMEKKYEMDAEREYMKNERKANCK